VELLAPKSITKFQVSPVPSNQCAADEFLTNPPSNLAVEVSIEMPVKHSATT